MMAVRNFNLQQIADSGQVFRWREIHPDDLLKGEVGYLIPAFKQVLRVEQVDDTVYMWCSEYEFYTYWEEYFDFNTNYEKFMEVIRDGDDLFLKEAVQYGSGIRILQQPFLETLITFMLSSANDIPRIKMLVNNLCRAYGTKILDIRHNYKPSFYNFPTLSQLEDVTVEELRELGMGFRAENIYYLIQSLTCGDFPTLETKQNSEALRHLLFKNQRHSTPNPKKLLKTIRGVGDKIADCFMLFALHDLDAFPVDTWIDKILFIEYGGGWYPYTEKKRDKYREAIIDKYFSSYKGFRGVIQQYMYYYYRTKEEVGEDR